MRKVLITVAILFVCLLGVLAAMIFGGRQLSLFIDRFGTVKMASVPIKSIAYEGSGSGGWLVVNDTKLSLDDAVVKNAPSFGSTKDDQFAVASGGKVFPFGALRSSGENGGEYLVATPQAGDDASVITHCSALGWPTPFDFNFMTGHSPSWKRYRYDELRWKKSSGATLEMLWRYEQSFYGKQLIPGNGWDTGFTVHEGSTGLIRVDIRS